MTGALPAALLVAAAFLVAVPGPAGRRARRVNGGTAGFVRPGPPLVVAVSVPVLALLLLGPVGLVVGVAVAPFLHRQVSGWETERTKRRRAMLVRQAPLALDLVAAVLAAGRSPQEAVRLVAVHTPPPLGDELQALAHRVRLAADPAVAWRSLDGSALEPVGRAFARAETSGAAIVPLMRDTAADLRRRAWAERRETVGRVGVRTTLPMGLCLLPAFVLVGVAPTVLAALGSVGF
ncbi:type II secretion system F family protein [Aeromicrobium senzhongii]|uniref:Type II secretion system F family protein n=1 Tax=Aeromicrobium senzhongii TaxID=2663859 RepID=A0ABX6ST36_9ACTN|nr:type II secretion system F family protein [Aeromicrobium senzhongii]MTB88459.1 type II secretion system F family protein [Aeromicrobium senzhongii]QNL94578.1 type II secretion system F family protein [Aeromicrobium senzhongii]